MRIALVSVLAVFGLLWGQGTVLSGYAEGEMGENAEGEHCEVSAREILCQALVEKKGAFFVGGGILSGDGVIKEGGKNGGASPANPKQADHVKDGSFSLLLGWLYRFTPRQVLRMELLAGFSSIGFGSEETPRLLDMGGVQAGGGLAYEWHFYRGGNFSWNVALGANYIAYHYRRGQVELFLQELMPKLGIGFEGRGQHYFELSFGVPAYTKLTVTNNQADFPTAEELRHLRSGFVYAYRF